MGNISSVSNCLNRINIKFDIVYNGLELRKYNPTHIIMPGVGAVGQAMKKIKKLGFIEELNFFIKEKKIFFCGICVGMQILSSYSEEFGDTKCLGWVPGRVKKFSSSGLSLPHMGWNTVKTTNSNNKLLNELNYKDFYFAHSYTFQCEEKFVIAKSRYGEDFNSVIGKNNIFGIQCHPEKSHKLGEIFFKNFINLNQNYV